MSTITNFIIQDQQLNEAEKQIWAILEEVTDPELPVLSIVDLGIVREVKFHLQTASANRELTIAITPTYSGCPATETIANDIKVALRQNGYPNAKIITTLSPAWTTDWMTESGKRKLQAYGIAPPVGRSFTTEYLDELKVACPLCQSTNTKLLSQFGSTACKALFKCDDCKEPFDYFKCH